MSSANTNRQIIQIAVLSACGVVIAQIFHLFGLGKAFLPLYVTVLIAGLLLGPKVGCFTGLFTPLISMLLTGMPPDLFMCSRMMLELGTIGFLCGFIFFKYRWNRYAVLPFAIIFGRIILATADTFVYVHFGRPPMSVYGNLIYSLSSCVPGLILQTLVIPLLVNRLEAILPRHTLFDNVKPKTIED